MCLIKSHLNFQPLTLLMSLGKLFSGVMIFYKKWEMQTILKYSLFF